MLHKITGRKQREYHSKHLIKAFENFRKIELQEFRSYLKSPWRIFWANFLVGTARGLGLLFGVAVVITLLGFLLKEYLSNLPYLGNFFKAVQVWMDQTLNFDKNIR